MSENEANFILYKAKNADDALVSASIFNKVQDEILPFAVIWWCGKQLY
jgi:hypothetical protein